STTSALVDCVPLSMPSSSVLIYEVFPPEANRAIKMFSPPGRVRSFHVRFDGWFAGQIPAGTQFCRLTGVHRFEAAAGRLVLAICHLPLPSRNHVSPFTHPSTTPSLRHANTPPLQRSILHHGCRSSSGLGTPCPP